MQLGAWLPDRSPPPHHRRLLSRNAQPAPHLGGPKRRRRNYLAAEPSKRRQSSALGRACASIVDKRASLNLHPIATIAVTCRVCPAINLSATAYLTTAPLPSPSPTRTAACTFVLSIAPECGTRPRQTSYSPVPVQGMSCVCFFSSGTRKMPCDLVLRTKLVPV